MTLGTTIPALALCALPPPSPRPAGDSGPPTNTVPRRPGAATTVTAVPEPQPDVGRGPRNRGARGPGAGRRQGVVGRGERGGRPRYGHQARGTDRAVAPQPGLAPAPVHRPAHPAA